MNRKNESSQESFYEYNIIENFNENKRKNLQERLNEKYDDIIKLQSSLITLDVGGCSDTIISKNTIINSKFSNILQKELNHIEKENSYLFLDMAERYIGPIINIMRKSIDMNDENKNITIIIDVDYSFLEEEIEKFFLQDSQKVKEKCKFVYSTKKQAHLLKLKDELTKKNNTKIWDISIKILCYKCKKPNDGSFNKIHYRNTKNDDYFKEGYFATCKKCDPNGNFKIA